MALRAKKPEAIQKRLKLFMFSEAGTGKTTASVQFPNAYIIDCEKGAENYDKAINAAGSVVFQTNDLGEIIVEVKQLLTERHEFRTLVIDPITTAYNTELDKWEQKVGSDFGRHYGQANKQMKRLYNLLMQLDMNVLMTAHAKNLYAPGEAMKVTGKTFDGWKGLDYAFDLVLELVKRPDKKRFARVAKTRLEAFPDGDVFEWSYDAFKTRYGAEMLEKQSQTVAMATAEQVARLEQLLGVVRIEQETIDKWLTKAGVDAFEDMPQEVIQKCITYVEKKLPAPAAA